MPPVETFERHDKAVLWAKTGVGRYGEPTLAAPVELVVRWDDKKIEMADKQGDIVSYDALVVVTQDILIGSLMWHGGLDDLPGTAYQPESDVMEVKVFDKCPDLKGRNYRRVVGLMRTKDALPGV